MFSPRAFAETDLRWLDRLFARDPFVTLLTVGADGLPEASRLPVLYRRQEQHIELSGHWARPNPQARRTGPAKVLVDGPHGYVSASWYLDKESAARVPTWNYAAAELVGQLHTFTDEAALSELMQQISDSFEASVGQAWQFEPERDDHRRQLRGIVGFRFSVEQAQITAKLSQNHPEANQLAVIEALEALSSARASELAQWMRLHRAAADG
jgi:transcriptional regulator